MAKFALIRSKSATVKAFNTRYTASKLLKQFKCKNLVELDKMKELEKKDNFSNIESYKLCSLSYSLHDAHDAALPNSGKCQSEPKKLFMFSDDAPKSAFAMDLVKDDVDILLFDLDQNEIVELSQTFEDQCAAMDTLKTLEEVDEIVDRLTDIEDETGIDILKPNYLRIIVEYQTNEVGKRNYAVASINKALTSGW